ncbi:hypothetical protein DL93DRAFT_2091361 [Clavulina sp. PMI_390]|nr:hypothetical protein DL93DRAFT_2091361 [Clavulina sp. PMI_390]
MKSFITGAAAVLLASSSLVSAALFGGSSAAATRDVEVTAAFPATNAFSHVTNGQNNVINVLINNKEDVEIDLKKIFGAFKDANSNAFVQNSTTAVYKSTVGARQKTTIPYTFYSEQKTGDVRLNIWVEYTVGGQPYTSQAFDSVVSVVEQPASWFDPLLILTYLIILVTVGGSGYLTYVSFFPPPKKSKSIPTPSAPVDVKATSSSTGYQEEWIPDHILKTRKGGKGAASGMSSGDESGAESAGGKKKSRK